MTSLAHNVPEFTVTEISSALKNTLEQTFSFVRVKGEISGCKKAASGHIYFTLKDMDSNLDSICWRGVSQKLNITPEDGLEVICTGRITTFAGRSKYQLIVEGVEIAGEGALLKMIEERKKKLDKEGLFDQNRKKPLPFLPETIAVITSPTGAVIRDILHRLNDRFARHVLVYPVLVQGEGADLQITKAIETLDALPQEGGPISKPDLIIVARGGGSLEDLMAFNEENVVRAAAACQTPLISAVGHETDWTLIDFAADYRAPTPTGAAEKAVPVKAELVAQILDISRRLVVFMERLFQQYQLQLESIMKGLINPKQYVEEMYQKLDDRTERFEAAMQNLLRHKGDHLEKLASLIVRPTQVMALAEQSLKSQFQFFHSLFTQFLERQDKALVMQASLLESVSYSRVLERGYSILYDDEKNVITSTKAVKKNMPIQAVLKDGAVEGVLKLDGDRQNIQPKKKQSKKTEPSKATKQMKLL